MMAGGRSRPKFMSTITSVPPASGIASGRSAFIVSASSSERGSSTSTADCLLYRRRGVSHRPERGLSAQYQVFIRCGLARPRADAPRTGQDQALELAGCSGRRPTSIVAQPEWRRAGVVLHSDDLDPLTVDSDDAGDDGEVDAVRFHPRPLLDVQLDERLHRVQVLRRLIEPIDVPTRRCQDLWNGNALPILTAAQPADIELAHQGQAPDEPDLEANAFLVGKPDDLHSLRHRIA